MTRPWDEFALPDVRAFVHRQYWYEPSRGSWAREVGSFGTNSRLVTDVIKSLNGNPREPRTRRAVEQLLREVEGEPIGD